MAFIECRLPVPVFEEGVVDPEELGGGRKAAIESAAEWLEGSGML